MSKTVISAFDEFLKDKVNLDSDVSSNARSSRDWLKNRIHEFPSKDDTFPNFYEGKDICFGSFARKTKKRELDDIDIMICLSANSSTYQEYSDHIEITVPDTAGNLKKLCNDNTNILNSRKVINKFISMLDEVPQYQKSELHLNKQAAVLNLTSYTWSFDIVPSFFTVKDSNGNDYYLIPDGNGNWMKTDPRSDRDKVSSVNQKHDGNVLNVIRIIKYWNDRPTMPTIKHYVLESMILNYYELSGTTCSKYVHIEIPDILDYISTEIYNQVEDPKGIQGNINDIPDDDKKKISDRASSDCTKASDARQFELDGDQKASIEKWGEIFGSEFPEYEDD